MEHFKYEQKQLKGLSMSIVTLVWSAFAEFEKTHIRPTDNEKVQMIVWAKDQGVDMSWWPWKC